MDLTKGEEIDILSGMTISRDSSKDVGCQTDILVGIPKAYSDTDELELDMTVEVIMEEKGPEKVQITERSAGDSIDEQLDSELQKIIEDA